MAIVDRDGLLRDGIGSRTNPGEGVLESDNEGHEMRCYIGVRCMGV